jgi:Replicase family/Primase C terminal 1 (PriCT-1)
MQFEFYQQDLFAKNLPSWIACADDLTDGITRLPAMEAVKRAHIAPNSAKQVWAMAFDIDRPEGGAAWIDADLPSPNWTAQNPRNGHAHLGYALLSPVSRSVFSRGCPQRYLARIQHAMTRALGADQSYAHFLTKTPGHARWRTIWGRQQPYRLDELALALPEDMPLPKRIKAGEAVGLGRNVTLFDGLRAWAYRSRLQYSRFDAFSEACLGYALSLNEFAAPLPLSELRSTARSVAKWTWANISSQGFSEVQAGRGVRSGTSRRAGLLDLQGALL